MEGREPLNGNPETQGCHGQLCRLGTAQPQGTPLTERGDPGVVQGHQGFRTTRGRGTTNRNESSDSSPSEKHLVGTPQNPHL